MGKNDIIQKITKSKDALTEEDSSSVNVTKELEPSNSNQNLKKVDKNTKLDNKTQTMSNNTEEVVRIKQPAIILNLKNLKQYFDLSLNIYETKDFITKNKVIPFKLCNIHDFGPIGLEDNVNLTNAQFCPEYNQNLTAD